MTSAFLLQFVGSLIAVALLVALAAWAKIARHAPALDETRARALLAGEFPDQAVGPVWVAADGRSAVARAGDQALLLAAIGDGWVSRTAPWSAVVGARRRGEHVLLATGDSAAPTMRLHAERWPPTLGAA